MTRGFQLPLNVLIESFFDYYSINNFPHPLEKLAGCTALANLRFYDRDLNIDNCIRL